MNPAAPTLSDSPSAIPAPNSPTIPPADRFAERHLQELDLATEVSLQASGAQCLVALAAGAVLAHAVSWRVAAAWCVLTLAWVAGARGICRGYRAQPVALRLSRRRRWRAASALHAAALGGLMGALPLLSFPGSPLEWKLALTLGILTVAAFCASRFTVPNLVSLLALLMPLLALAWGLWGAALSWPAWGVLLLFCPVHVLIGERQHRLDRSQRALTVRNEVLASSLARQNEVLVSANRSKASLMAAASHDLRQPVHALGMLVELMDPERPGEMQRHLASARSCAHTLSDMLMQLLDFNRLDLGLYKPDLQPVAPSALLDEVYEAFHALAAQKKLSLTIACEAVLVRSDPRLLRRLLFNLVSNAIKYTLQGSVRIACRVEEGLVCLSVSDTGVGIPQERLGDVFAEYVRLAHDRSEGEDGLGVGLSIVSNAAELLGHALRVESRVGAGTVFRLNLGMPLPSPAPARLPDGSPVALPAVAIAVIENDPIVLEGLIEALQAWGCVPIGARGLAEILDLLAATGATPALILSDMHLDSAGNGLEAIASLRGIYGLPRLPAVMLTADLDPAFEKRVREQGVRLAYKPLQPPQLRAVLAHALAQGTA